MKSSNAFRPRGFALGAATLMLLWGSARPALAQAAPALPEPQAEPAPGSDAVPPPGAELPPPPAPSVDAPPPPAAGNAEAAAKSFQDVISANPKTSAAAEAAAHLQEIRK